MTVYRDIADSLERDPRGNLRPAPGGSPAETRVMAVAARLLEDSAAFFQDVGRQNEPLQEQMDQNAAVYRDVASLLREAPFEPVN